jgi:hypothetical protein
MSSAVKFSATIQAVFNDPFTATTVYNFPANLPVGYDIITFDDRLAHSQDCLRQIKRIEYRVPKGDELWLCLTLSISHT